MKHNNWQTLFEGREENLNWLKRVWSKARSGEPQLAMILGETGLGKTRLVQEFFSSLSKEEFANNNNYWPDSLDVDRNLSLNPLPEDINTKQDIPWLWWGMRFAIPTHRNNTIAQSPFEAEDVSLMVHAFPILRMHQYKATKFEAAKIFSTIVADIASIGVYGSALSILDMFKLKSQEKENSRLSFSEANVKRVETLVENTLARLEMFLNPKSDDCPTVPVILVLDDAQWIDPITVNALRIIFEQATAEQWPLMVIGTHWEKEWQEYPDNLDNSIHTSNLKQVYNVFNDHNPRLVNTLWLKKLESNKLRLIPERALPGIDKIQIEQLVTEADGNPRSMEEMVLLLLNRPTDYFLNGDSNQPLNRKGKSRLAKLQHTSIYQKIIERYSELNTELQDFLSSGALFGPEFIRPLVVDLLIHSPIDDYLSFENINKLADEAQDIHALVQNLEVNCDVFQQKIYHNVAKDYLKIGDEECYEARFSSISNILNKWVTSEKHKSLNTNEQIILFKLVINHACNNPDSILSPKNIAYAFDSLIEAFDNRSQEGEVAKWWSVILTNHGNHWYLEFLEKLEFAPDHIETAINFDINLLKGFLILLPQIDNMMFNPKCPDSLSRKANWLINAGGVYTDPDLAKQHYLNAIEIYRNIIDVFGSSYERLWYLSQSLMIMAGLIQQKIRWTYSTEKLTLTQQKKLLEQEVQDKEFMNLLQEALHITREIIKQFGTSPSRFNMLSQRIIEFAHGLKRLEENTETIAKYYQESLAICRENINNFGATPESLASLSHSLMSLSNYNCDTETAGIYLKECLHVDQSIINDFGSSYERLVGVSDSLFRVGKNNIDCDEVAVGLQQLAESIQIIRDIIIEFGETPSLLFMLSFKLNNLADLTLKFGKEVDPVRNNLQEIITIERSIINKYGITPLRLANLGDSIIKLARFCGDIDNNMVALQAHCQEALKVEKSLTSLNSSYFNTYAINLAKDIEDCLGVEITQDRFIYAKTDNTK
ncbi:AAA family ATPase [Shewanella sp. 3_MG-2023]|uniref:AAA family ATPase n=1 Tax=Shewanella sp. 3_MG-2023 TaxID=3062635 RepID=UPI0026E220EF|nr:ATP-binding protein [Shewanella sp. 3_MG-2023]MDO6776233.1 AAA family ATPase [Shewanella sp. 3_MG-2023]